MKNPIYVGRLATGTAAALVLGLGGAQNASAYDWTGFYAGGSVGVLAYETNFNDYWCFFACDAPDETELELSAGVQGGYNWQLSENFVVGLEADFSTGGKITETVSYGPSNGSFNGAEYKSEWKWLLTVRGRAGLNVNRTMAYVTGGFAFADGKFRAADISDGVMDDYFASTSKTLTGLVGGAGVEHALTDNLRLKVEVLSILMPREDACWRRMEVNDGACIRGEGASDDYVGFKTSGTSARIGLNWNF